MHICIYGILQYELVMCIVPYVSVEKSMNYFNWYHYILCKQVCNYKILLYNTEVILSHHVQVFPSTIKLLCTCVTSQVHNYLIVLK